MIPRIFVSTNPFGEIDSKPLRDLEASGFEYTVNPLGRKLTSKELAHYLKGYNGLIAGTENVTREALDGAPDLKIVSRVGIGLDSVPLDDCRKRGVAVSYTPDAPSDAVAELTLGLALDLCRGITQADRMTRDKEWKRYMGLRLGKMSVAVIGAGRIGRKVISLLKAFGPREILVNDIKPDQAFGEEFGVRWVDKEEAFRSADLVTLHVPLTGQTRNLVTARELGMMKKEAYLINTSRGGIVSEAALYDALKANRIAGAAVDVFEVEPYQGELSELKNVLLTQHMGSCSQDCRSRMEIEATEEVIRFFKGQGQSSPVPEAEYQIQSGMKAT